MTQVSMIRKIRVVSGSSHLYAAVLHSSILDYSILYLLVDC